MLPILAGSAGREWAGLEEGQPWGQPCGRGASLHPPTHPGWEGSGGCKAPLALPCPTPIALPCPLPAWGRRVGARTLPRDCFGAQWMAARVFQRLEILESMQALVLGKLSAASRGAGLGRVKGGNGRATLCSLQRRSREPRKFAREMAGLSGCRRELPCWEWAGGPWAGSKRQGWAELETATAGTLPQGC